MADQLHDLVQRMIDAGESEENIATVIREYKPAATAQPQLRSRTGQMYTPPAESGGREFLKGAKDAALAAIDPRTYINAVRAAYADPAEFAKNAVLAPVHLAGSLITDPAETLGGLTGGVATSTVIPTSIKPIARGTGTLMTQVGKKGAWPIRMMGAHQLGAGNPLGAAVMAIPDALEAGGARLSKFGGADTSVALPSGARNIDIKGEVRGIRTAPPASRPAPPLSADAEELIPTPGTPYGHGEVPPITGAQRAQMAADELIAQGKIRRKADYPNAGKPLQRTPPTPAVLDTPASPLPADVVEGMGSRATAMGDQAVTDMRAAGMNVPKSGIQSTHDIDAMVAGPQPPPAAAPVRPVTRPQAPSTFDRMMTETQVPADITVEGTEGINPPPPTVGVVPPVTGAPEPAVPAVSKANVVMPDEWFDAFDKAMTGAKKPKPERRSFLGENSSTNDVQMAKALHAAGYSPEEAAQQAKILKAGRHMNNYTNAQLSAFERQMLDREPE